jgi:monoamine oxidase
MEVTKGAMPPTRRATLLGLGTSAIVGPAYARTNFTSQVIVIGAGASGLETALRLEAAGIDVQVVEASNRIGGRMNTLYDLPGQPNAGGVQIGASYIRLRARAAALGVELFPEPTTPRATSLNLGGRMMAARDWSSAPENSFPAAFKNTPPSAALFAVAGGPNNPLKTFDDWRGPLGIGADVSADTFLTSKGFDAAARRLIDVGLNGNRLDSYSIVNVMRSLTLFGAERASGGVSSMIRGGSQRLPEAMARALKKPVMLGQGVRRISTNAQGGAVTLANGTRLKAQAIVAAVPFPVLRGMSIRAPMSRETREAIGALPYTQIMQIFLEPEKRYWEIDGLPIDMWTDGPLERLFSVRDSESKDTGIIYVWLNGTGAQGFDVSAVSTRMNVLRPASEGKFKVRHVQDWTSANALAGGAYMHWAPGQIARWAGKMGAPAGRLFFAGEHLGLVHTGMEAAFESAETAATDVLIAFGRAIRVLESERRA